MCNPAKMYIMAAPELVGVMPIRSDVTVKPFDDVRALAITFACFENIGFSIQYSQGIQQISFASAPSEGWPTYGATG